VKLAAAFHDDLDFFTQLENVAQMERVGLDMVWVPEAYGADAISRVGFICARTTTVEIGTSIVNVFSRSAALIAMTAASCDELSAGRFCLGLGASGPGVIEGFHGVPFRLPRTRTIDYITACRRIWERSGLFELAGGAVRVPLDGRRPLKLVKAPLRSRIPIWWASMGDASVEATAAYADGWLPMFFIPELANTVWGEALAKGTAARDPALGPLQIAAGGLTAIGEDLRGEGKSRVLDLARPMFARYLGGMGPPGANYYNDLACRYGYAEAAAEVQSRFLAGDKAGAAAAVPEAFIDAVSLVGPPSFVAERLAAFAAAGVTMLMVDPVADPVGTVVALRGLACGG
jgi:F420-dependent oxidoreductase-like protein